MDLGYALKNIPVPPNGVYTWCLVEKVESVLRRMRWKAYYLLKGSDDSQPPAERFGFKSARSPPQVEELKGFELDMTNLIGSIKFRRVNDSFQDKMNQDIKSMKQSGEIIVKADKTRNLYKVPKDSYKKLMDHNITRNYKHAPVDAYIHIIMEAKEIDHGLDIADRVEVMAQADAFVTLKNHKDRFANDLPCRLINPAKSDLGRVSKAMLERLVSAVRVGTGVKLWKNTAAVIEWFRGIDRKHECTLLAEIIDRSGIGLYRDDGLAVLRNAFASFGLRVPIEANLKVVNYLDVTLNLQNGNYQPYRKPNDNPLYLNIQSYHPPNILRNLPKAVAVSAPAPGEPGNPPGWAALEPG